MKLGVITDSELSMKLQAQMVFQLPVSGAEHEASGSDGFPTSSISHFVDQYTAAALIHAFITGRLDYCNGLLAGTPRVVTDVYQNVQNAAARLLAGHGHGKTSGRHGLRQVMRDELHWLRVVYLRIKNY